MQGEAQANSKFPFWEPCRGGRPVGIFDNLDMTAQQ